MLIRTVMYTHYRLRKMCAFVDKRGEKIGLRKAECQTQIEFNINLNRSEIYL
ncbi:hypothetical protein EXN66_Car019198 [Channa argus]|uniref:Uncharacterized protein n=1 Tax=Channa argus TaxID=215402 RepID=A0A6G1QLC8_CHAAH|nr:hypothetical protein EXN66_Car019198 [Channa argus]